MTAHPIKIMSPGQFTASAGQQVNITADDLRALANGYDPEKFQAPIVAGEPQHDDPAYGWVKALTFKDGALHAVPEHLEPTFGQAVATGQFKKRRVSFYPPQHSNNPTPGSPHLRHVAFHGIVAPAVPGLRPAAVAYADRAAQVFELDPAALDFTAPAGYTVTVDGKAIIQRARAYAAKHALPIVEAIKRMDAPQLAAMDELRTSARTKGISIIEAAILAGNTSSGVSE